MTDIANDKRAGLLEPEELRELRRASEAGEQVSAEQVVRLLDDLERTQEWGERCYAGMCDANKRVKVLSAEVERLRKESVDLAEGGGAWARNAEHFRQRAARLEAALRTLAHDIDAAESYRANQGKGGQTVGMVPALHSCMPSALNYLRQLVRDADPELAKGGG